MELLIALTVIMSLLGLIAAAGNFITLIFLLLTSKLRSSVLSTLLLSLAFSDFLVGIVATPVMIKIYWDHYDCEDSFEYVLDPHWAVSDLLMTATLLNTVLLTVDRLAMLT